MIGYPLFEHYNNIFKFLLDVKMTVLDVFMTALIFLDVKGGGADVPLFETIKTNKRTQPKNELQH